MTDRAMLAAIEQMMQMLEAQAIYLRHMQQHLLSRRLGNDGFDLHDAFHGRRQ
jgi:hypothetical protein